MMERKAATKTISILGATGSIGRSALSVVETAAEGRFAVEALTAGSNAEALAAAAKQFGARFAAVADEAAYPALKAALSGSGVEAAAGAEAVIEAAARPADCVLAAVVGAAGLPAALAAAEAGADLALANKEALVTAGPILLDALRRGGGRLLPVDSEHNAIFQIFDFERPERVSRITLTASGGPFRSWSSARMAEARPSDALKHPTWSMGAKISIDSATLFNKGLEVIEAARLFPVAASQVEVVVHPQSVVHGLVEYVDGSLLAQLGPADMRTPIAYAFSYPDRASAPVTPLDLIALARLDFEAPDLERFPALSLCRRALGAGVGATAALNAANEVAVAAFLAERIGFLDIARVVERVLDAQPSGEAGALGDLEAALGVDAWARAAAEAVVSAGAAVK